MPDALAILAMFVSLAAFMLGTLTLFVGGMLADLQRYGRSDRTAPDAWARGAITTIERRTLADII